MSHLGRPDGLPKPEFSLVRVAHSPKRSCPRAGDDVLQPWAQPADWQAPFFAPGHTGLHHWSRGATAGPRCQVP
eukprot:scaffold51165_cov32-Tisochrysis_lutea.AAC.2